MDRTVYRAVEIVVVVLHVTLSMEAVRLAVLLDGLVAPVIKVRLRPYNSLEHATSEHSSSSVLTPYFDSNNLAERLVGVLKTSYLLFRKRFYITSL